MTLKDELQEHICDISHDMIVCAEVSYSDRNNGYEDVQIYLRIDNDVDEFLDKLDLIDFDTTHGLDVIIWYADGTWSTRERDIDDEYSHWLHHVRPNIPEYLH